MKLTYLAGIGNVIEADPYPEFRPIDEGGFAAITAALRRFGQGVRVDPAGRALVNSVSVAMAHDLIKSTKQLQPALEVAKRILEADQKTANLKTEKGQK